MNKNLEKVNKKIETITKEINAFNESKPVMEEIKEETLKQIDDAHNRLKEATKDIDAKIKALMEKRDNITRPIKEELNKLDEKRTEINRTFSINESKPKQLQKLQKIKEVLEKIKEGYFVFSAEELWGSSLVHLGQFKRNNYNPDGWHIIDMMIKGTSVYCQSDRAKSPRKLFNMEESYRWTIKLQKELKPKQTNGGKCKTCPKCKDPWNSMVTSKVCPVCRDDQHYSIPIEYTCRRCGYVEDARSNDKHSFSEEPEQIEIKAEG